MPRPPQPVQQRPEPTTKPVSPSEPPEWRDIIGRLPPSLIDAILDGAAKCSPDPVQEWCKRNGR
jgi:hypothetical protein